MVHAPSLRHHELPQQEGAIRIAPLSLKDYTGDLVRFVDALDSPPLLVGHSMGGLLAQLVAARADHAGLVAVCPGSAAGIFGTTPTNTRMFLPSLMRIRPWAKPVHPPKLAQFRRWLCNTQTDETTREIYDGLVCESGRAICEMAVPVKKVSEATTVDFSAVKTPVLVMAGERPHREARSCARDGSPPRRWRARDSGRSSRRCDPWRRVAPRPRTPCGRTR